MKSGLMSVCSVFTPNGSSRFCKHCRFTELMHKIHKKVEKESKPTQLHIVKEQP